MATKDATRENAMKDKSTIVRGLLQAPEGGHVEYFELNVDRRPLEQLIASVSHTGSAQLAPTNADTPIDQIEAKMLAAIHFGRGKRVSPQYVREWVGDNSGHVPATAQSLIALCKEYSNMNMYFNMYSMLARSLAPCVYMGQQSRMTAVYAGDASPNILVNAAQVSNETATLGDEYVFVYEMVERTDT